MEDTWELRSGLVAFGSYTGSAPAPGTLPRHLQQRMDELTRRSKVLEFGSGEGTFLSALREHGHDAWGVEMHPEFTKDASVRSFVVRSLEALSQSEFDLVHMNHVLEHVERPVELLKSLASRLRHGGQIIIEVPSELVSARSTLRRLLGRQTTSATSVYQHTQYFSKKSLGRAVERAGLRVEALRTESRSPNKLYSTLDLALSPLGYGELITAVALRA